MSSASNVPASRSTAKQEGRQIYVIVFVGLAFVVAVFAYSTLYFGYVEGQEFAADSFNRREFSFYQIPLLGLQITPIDRRDVTNDLEKYLVSQKLIAPRSTAAAALRWDLIYAQRGHVASPSRLLSQGEARILCSYLDASDAKGNHIWLAWTKSNLTNAQVVWPAVAQVARQELYLLVPEILLRARNARDSGELKQEIDQLLTEKYLAFGLIQQQLNNHEAAVELFTSALTLTPEQSDAFIARAKSLETLGKQAEAPDDTDQAEKLKGK